MSDLPRWALDKAEAFLARRWPSQRVERDDLVRLLVEVRHDSEAEVQHPTGPDGYCTKCREGVLAEVRRVVEDQRRSYERLKPLSALRTTDQICCDDILARLDRLEALK